MPSLERQHRNRIGIIAAVTIGGAMIAAIYWFGFDQVIPWIRVITFISVVFVAIEITLFTKRQRRKARGLVDGLTRFKDEIGVVLRPLNPDGKIKVLGEIWDARESSGQHIQSGATVRVIGARRNHLIVELNHTYA